MQSRRCQKAVCLTNIGLARYHITVLLSVDCKTSQEYPKISANGTTQGLVPRMKGVRSRTKPSGWTRDVYIAAASPIHRSSEPHSLCPVSDTQAGTQTLASIPADIKRHIHHEFEPPEIRFSTGVLFACRISRPSSSTYSLM